MVSWMLVEQISFYPGSKTMRFLIAIIVSAFYTSFPASVYARCCEESDDTRETPWIALQERNPDFGESDCSLVGSCSGERYCFCLPRKQNYSFLLLKGRIYVFQGYFKIKSPWKSGEKGQSFPCLQGIWKCKSLMENCFPIVVLKGCSLTRSIYHHVALFFRKCANMHKVLQWQYMWMLV